MNLQPVIDFLVQNISIDVIVSVAIVLMGMSGVKPLINNVKNVYSNGKKAVMGGIKYIDDTYVDPAVKASPEVVGPVQSELSNSLRQAADIIDDMDTKKP